MSGARPLAVALLLAAGRVAAACPLCADSNTPAGGAGTSVWWAVGAFLLVPPILGAFVLGFLRKELGSRKERDAARGAALPDGFVRFRA